MNTSLYLTDPIFRIWFFSPTLYSKV